MQTRDFSWNTSLNFSHNDNKVISVSNSEFNAGVLNQYDPHLPGLSQGCNTQRIVEGKPIGSFYLWEWAGYNDNGISTFYRYDGNGNRILDENGNPETTIEPGEADRIYMGNAQPKLTMGWDPPEFAYIIEELLHESPSEENKQPYYNRIIETIISTGQAENFIAAISHVIQRLSIDQLHLLGDIFCVANSLIVIVTS